MEDNRQAIFHDVNGQSWEINITVGVIKQIRLKLGINLAEALDFDLNGKPKTQVMETIAADPVLLVDVIYVICEEQANARNVTSEQFGQMFQTGEMIEEATNALLQGILKFLPPSKRLAMEKILQIANRNMEKVKTEAEKALQDPQVEAEIDRIWKEQFTNMQE